MCLRPYRQGVMEFGCSQCMPCRLNRRRLWTGRLLLEQQSHAASSFVTLTYADEYLPSDGSLSARAVQLFLKRLRNHVGPVRYFAVGEYGGLSDRPHYHVALFGTADEVAVQRSWPSGFTYVGSLTAHSAAYIAGYVTKKMTHASDERLAGRAPEFARMSLRPGIGALAVEAQLAASYVSRRGARALAHAGDVVGRFRSEGSWPLGRYLKGKLRDAVGMDQELCRSIYRVAAADRRDQLKDPGARALVEGKRAQSRHRARVIESQCRSKGIL